MEKESGQGVSRILDTAVLGTVGYITIDSYSLKSTNATMIKLIAKKYNVYILYRRSLYFVTPYRNPNLQEDSNFVK